MYAGSESVIETPETEANGEYEVWYNVYIMYNNSVFILKINK